MKKISDASNFAEKSKIYIQRIAQSFENLPIIEAKSFDKNTTAIVNIDIINGFCREGILASPLVEDIIPYAVKIDTMFKDFIKIFFVDMHAENCAEFRAYPEHCLENTKEAEIVDELKPFIGNNSIVFKKNSVNGFVCPDFLEWIYRNKKITNFILIGDVTDICVFNFANTLKAFFNQWNIKSRIIIPIKGVETYQLDETNHDAQLMNIFALYNMRMNGIEIVEDIV